MMRGGGETRHLAWMRELSALGVEVDVITGQPLLLGARALSGRPSVTATMLRSPYLRDSVYRFQHTRGFGRLTMTALHLRRRVVLPRGVAARSRARATPPDVVHAHALYQAARLRRGDIPGGHQSARRAARRGTPPTSRGRRAGRRRLGGGAPAGDARLRRSTRVPKGVDAERVLARRRRTCARELGSRTSASCSAVGRLVPIKNIALLIEAHARCVRRRSPIAHLRARRRRSGAGRSAKRRPTALGVCRRRHVRRLRAAGRTAAVLPHRRCVRALVRLRQLAERRARSDGLRAAGGGDRCRRRPRVRRQALGGELVPPDDAPALAARARATGSIAPTGAPRPAAHNRAASCSSVLLARERAAAARRSTTRVIARDGRRSPSVPA